MSQKLENLSRLHVVDLDAILFQLQIINLALKTIKSIYWFSHCGLKPNGDFLNKIIIGEKNNGKI